MHIGVDIRALMGKHYTGVPRYSEALLRLFLKKDTQNIYTFFSNASGINSEDVQIFDQSNISYVHGRIPNKLLSASVACSGHPKLDSWVAYKTGKTVDTWLSPNIHFTCLEKNTKHILVVHDISFLFFPWLYSYKQRMWHRAVRFKKQVKEADYIIVPSESTKEDLISFLHVDSSKIIISYPQLSQEYVQDVPQKTQEKIVQKFAVPEKYFLYVGSIEPRKNISSIVSAFVAWKKTSRAASNVELLIAGALGWRSQKIVQQIAQTKDARYIGYISDSEKKVLLTHAQALVYPSIYEGFGIPLYESFHVGTPVITSNRSSMLEVAGSAGFFIHPHKVHELVDAFEYMITDEHIYKKLSLATQVQHDFFDTHSSVEKIINIFNH